jgi:ribonucleoside-diphosphate reductase alpha chain
MTTKASAKKVVSKKPTAKKGTTQYRKFIKQVKKRNGTKVLFDFDKLINAIHKAMIATGEGSLEEATMVAHQVAADLVRVARKHKDFIATVEGVQDEVEKQLILSDYVATAKAYILYRAERAKEREMEQVEVPEHVKQLVKESEKYFEGNKFGEFVFMRTYARWIPEEGRRETWIETIDRYMAFMKENVGKKLTEKEYTEVREAILNQEVMPSMRLLQFAGDAARRCNVVAYNCSYLAPTKIKDFAEGMYLSMSGTGVGFSVESETVQKLPQIKRQSGERKDTHVVVDSKEGWCDALTLGLKTWWGGDDIDFDFSELRPAGARLKTMGGKSSGPDPLRELLVFAREKIMSRQGKRLSNIDVHDIMCKIAEVVVAGGVRRSAMISLSDLDDRDMREAKSGQFYIQHPQRSMSNNSAIYTEKPSATEFLNEWVALMKSGSGERGIFNRGAQKTQMPTRRLDYLHEKLNSTNGDLGPLGTNPCGEIILQSKQFCNLTEVIARKEDNEKSLVRKARIATILGTYQSSLTKFGYISKEWTKNVEDERLLGVSITGQWDSPAVRDEKVLRKMKAMAQKTNVEYAKKLGINPSTAITAVKPSGTTSKTLDSSSGMHTRFAPYYVQRIRISATDSLFKMLKEQGVPYHPEVGQSLENATTYVLEFGIKSPKGAIVTSDMTALDQLEHWKKVKENYTEHNPSITISVGDDEWIAVANWLYEHWDIVGGLSFLPRNDHVYQLAPMEEIDEKRYKELVAKTAHIDFSKLPLYELRDETDVKKELACAGGLCEIEI